MWWITGILVFFYLLHRKPDRIDDYCFCGITVDQSMNVPLDMQLTTIPTRVSRTMDPGSHYAIPLQIFQTNENETMPWGMAGTVNKITELNPQFNYRFFNSAERLDFLETYMDNNVVEAYKTLVPGAFKADLFRYSVIYTYGGCYMDIGSFTVLPLLSVIDPEDKFVSTVDAYGSGINSAFFCAVRHSQILKNTIDLVVQAVRNRQYGRTAIDITGPQRFGQGFLNYVGRQKKIEEGIYGEGVKLYDRKSAAGCLLAYLTREEEVFVVSKYTEYYSDASWWLKKERYEAIWKARKVFGELDQILINTTQTSHP